MNYLFQQAETEEIRRVATHRIARIVVLFITVGLAAGLYISLSGGAQ